MMWGETVPMVGIAFPTALLELLFQLCQVPQKQKLGLGQGGFYGMDILR